MKKFFFILCSLLMSPLFSQDDIAKFTLSYFEKSPVYDVQASEDGDFFISFYSLDSSSPEGGIVVKAKQLSDFKTQVDSAKVQYARWSKVAKENNVTELDKTITTMPSYKSYFMYGGKWHFDHATTLTFRYKIMPSGKHALIITTGELTASDNEYMDIDGLALVFLSIDEVDEFLLTLDPQKVVSHYEQKRKQENLFK